MGSLRRLVVDMLQEVVIMKDRTTGKSRGFGFVTFRQSSDAAHAGNKEHMVDGRRCEVSTAPVYLCSFPHRGACSTSMPCFL